MKRLVQAAVRLMLAILLAACGGNAGGDVNNSAPAPSLSGTVTSSSAAMEGVIMTLSGAGSAVVTTDASGNYSFTGLADGSYTLTPSKVGYVFSPSFKTLTKNISYLAEENFVGNTGGIGSIPLYFPIKVGNKWIRRAVLNPAAGTSTWTETSEVIRYDGTYYSMQVTSASKSIDYLAFTNNEWTLEKVESYGPVASSLPTLDVDTFSPPKLLFPSSADIGTHDVRTTVDSRLFTLLQSNYAVDITVAALESVTVPAGTFQNTLKCIYTTTNLDVQSSSTTTSWFADGVGEVKSVSPDLTMELTNFKFN